MEKSRKRLLFEVIWKRVKPSEESQSRLSEFVVPIVKAKTAHGDISFYCPGGRTVGRAKTLLTKEKYTIDRVGGRL